ncbi:MAG TPA: hypothetical protein EYP60_09345 [bacterium (Candidatus Stahlbacteria)]|nr:hypothetical protein [Candidatus Stahlbacteria bacterium]
MQRQVPLVLTFITGIVVVIGLLVPHRPFGTIEERFLVWYAIIFGFTLVLGIDSLIKVHANKIRRREPGFGYSAVLIASIIVTLTLGIYSIIKYGSAFDVRAPFMFLYWNFFLPCSATMFSLLAFFIASAAYRAFRATTIDATLLLIAGALVMIGRVPIGHYIWGRLPGIAEWIMSVLQMTGMRGILIGISLGMIATSLRIILGIERAYIR